MKKVISVLVLGVLLAGCCSCHHKHHGRKHHHHHCHDVTTKIHHEHGCK